MGVIAVIGCGPSNQDPLLAPGALPSIAREDPVVVCPAGSQWDAAKGVCLAVADVPPPPKEETPVATPEVKTDVGGTISVACSFSNGWVTVMPVAKYPRDDQFLMQALIGLTEEPSFWMKEREYVPLAPYKAKRCTKTPVAFSVAKGAYWVLAAEAGTFAARGDYTRNGFKKKMDLDPDAPQAVSLKASDLTHTWLCVSCPWVAFLDPFAAPAGAYLPSFVVLKNRRSKADRGTDRVATSIPVKGGVARLQVIEAEREVTHLDELALEIEGKIVLPAPGKRSALAADDGIEVEMARGKRVEVTFEVDGVPDGTHAGFVIATGHYEPTAE